MIWRGDRLVKFDVCVSQRELTSEEAILHDAPHRADPISPADFFAFVVPTMLVPNRPFGKSQTASGPTCCQFDLNSKARLAELVEDGFKVLSTRHLVAGFDIAQSDPDGDACQPSDSAVDGLMPGGGKLAIAVAVSRAIRDVCFTGQDRLQEESEIIGVVFLIRILDHDNASCGCGDTGANGGTLPAILSVMESCDVGFLSKLVNGLLRAVLAAIID